jgi:hypothetical protein
MNSNQIEPLNRNRPAAAGAPWRAVRMLPRRLFAVIMAMLVLFWASVVVIVAVTFSLTAWEDRGGQNPSVALVPTATVTAAPTVEEKPSGVPDGAQLVQGDLVLGDVSDRIYFFADSSCTDGVLTIALTRAAVYSETPCTQALPADSVRRLIGQPVRVRIIGARMLLEALFVGVFEFDVGRVWVQIG